jgi:hypothetical protein
MAGVLQAVIAPRSKGETALAELDRLQAAGVRFGVVLADAGYGTSAVFPRKKSDPLWIWKAWARASGQLVNWDAAVVTRPPANA